jgi:hypothetical protein
MFILALKNLNPIILDVAQEMKKLSKDKIKERKVVRWEMLVRCLRENRKS